VTYSSGSLALALHPLLQQAGAALRGLVRRKVLNEERGHLVWRVVMNPMGRLGTSRWPHGGPAAVEFLGAGRRCPREKGHRRRETDARTESRAAHTLASFSIGAGPFVLGDARGLPVDPATADPASTCVYIFYDDYDTTNAAPCNTQQCVGIARALVQDVTDAAFGGANAKPTTELFFKYHAGGASSFMEPAASGSVDDARPGGHYTAVLSRAFELSALYDRAIQKVILAYKSPGSGDILFRTSGNLLNWPDAEIADASIHEDGGDRYPSLIGELPNAIVGDAHPLIFYTNGLTDWRSSTFMNRRINIAETP